jgi:hypothetical protein
MFSIDRTYDERELSPIFEDYVPVVTRILRRAPEPSLLARLEARRGKRSESEQPSQEVRREFLDEPLFTRGRLAGKSLYDMLAATRT